MINWLLCTYTYRITEVFGKDFGMAKPMLLVERAALGLLMKLS